MLPKPQEYEARRAEAPSGARRREERCDDRKAPDGAERNRHAPGGSRAAAGVKGTESASRYKRENQPERLVFKAV